MVLLLIKGNEVMDDCCLDVSCVFEKKQRFAGNLVAEVEVAVL